MARAGSISMAAYTHGLDVELVDAVLREAKVPYEIRLYPWERVKRMLDRGEVMA